MMSLRKPRPELVRAFLDAQVRFDLTCSTAGAAAGQPPPGYLVDHTRARVGEGEADYLQAKAAIEGWKQFPAAWAQALPSDTPIEPGRPIGVLARTLGVWFLNACRIVRVIDEASPVRRFGFAYGTLPDHAGTGEERFLVEYDPADGGVWYDILAFSRPWRAYARLGYPWMRRSQRRFGRDSVAAMRLALRQNNG